ncbi:D-aminoacyl-tRNA deacylase [Thermosyntropha sp.]|uniref:D-aminoacyl-tRNA deacylase n=1 Tax=Thermosyntropha sp. TaxID=2740820 RepID=UPI0025D2A60A|nr:D-aminoacyl-tRNA deacylase [Thermosyntropha sp.]MBO8159299.1 D-tyrosyl-tRNA(Tyr) deacylase [Thermosyntropha sp.]
MRAVVQRTNHSMVTVEGQVKGEIKQGLTVLLGIKKGDTEKDAEYIIDKIVNLRIFEDEKGKMNLSLLDVGGEILLVSQFTLYGDARKGRRPSFTEAELPEKAQELFDYSLEILRSMDIKVETGVFGADMKVLIENDGPCTILLDSERLF